MPRVLAALVFLSTACGVDLPLREDVTYTCRADADCPLAMRCAPGAQVCVRDLDVTPPHLTSITALTRESVALVFDEQLAPATASLPSSFTIIRDDGQPLDVEAAAPVEDGKSIVLRTAIQRGAASYSVVTSVTDVQGNAPVLDQSAFTGFGPAPNPVAPDATAPTSASVIVIPVAERGNPRVTLAWSPRQGAIAYTIEVSSRPDFGSINHTIVVSGDDATVDLAVAEGTTYFWRVRSDATTPGSFGTSSFTVLFDTLYVFCPADSACSAATGIGSKNVPLAAISRAVSLATDRSIGTIAIAGRGNVSATGQLASYHEPIALTGAGVTLRGGYESTFTAAPDRVVNRTRIFYEGSVIISIQNQGAITIEKLEIEAVLDPTIPPSTQNLSAAAFQSPGADITFSDALITTTDVGAAEPSDQHPNTTTGAAVLFGYPHHVHLDAKTKILAGSARVTSQGLVSLVSNLDIDGTELVSRPVYLTIDGVGSEPLFAFGGEAQVRNALLRGAQSERGTVVLLGVSGTFETSTVIGGDGFACGGVWLQATSAGAMSFTRNTIIATSSCQSGIGVAVFGSYPVTVANNLIIADTSGTAIGLLLASAGPTLAVNNTVVTAAASGQSVGALIQSSFPDIANNLFVFQGASASVGVRESSDNADPKALVSNVFIDCDAPYLDEAANTPLADPNAIAGQALGCPSCGTTRASGNLALAGINPFIDLDGPDGNLDTLDDDDLRLTGSEASIASGGVDTAAAACGTNETPSACGQLTVDFAGQPRTPPISVGAYEKD